MGTFREIEIDSSKDDGTGTFEVEFTGDCHWENDGIGWYEYWGFKQFDKGFDYVECENISWAKETYTAEANAVIQTYLDNNYESIEEGIINDYKSD